MIGIQRLDCTPSVGGLYLAGALWFTSRLDCKRIMQTKQTGGGVQEIKIRELTAGDRVT